MTTSYNSDMKKAAEGRTTLLSIRLRPEEYRRLVVEAEAMYVPLSAYVRHRLFGPNAPTPRSRRQGRAGKSR